MNLITRIKNKLSSLVQQQHAKPTLTKQKIAEFLGTATPTVFEIGAANGDDSLEFLETFPGGTLYAFEPEPKNIVILKNRIHSDHFHLFEGVMSDTDGTLTFNRSRTDNPDDLSFSGSIMKPKKHLELWDWIHFDQTATVPSITLDTFSKQHNLDVIDFIWCDVQGAEEKVILGGKEILEKRVRYFYTEYSNDEQYEGQPTLERILQLLPSFEVVENFGQDILLKNKNL